MKRRMRTDDAQDAYPRRRVYGHVKAHPLLAVLCALCLLVGSLWAVVVSTAHVPIAHAAPCNSIKQRVSLPLALWCVVPVLCTTAPDVQAGQRSDVLADVINSLWSLVSGCGIFVWVWHRVAQAFDGCGTLVGYVTCI